MFVLRIIGFLMAFGSIAWFIALYAGLARVRRNISAVTKEPVKDVKLFLPAGIFPENDLLLAQLHSLIRKAATVLIGGLILITASYIF
jgi:hypothetical protein